MAGRVDSSANDTASIMENNRWRSNLGYKLFPAAFEVFDIFFINDTMGWAVGIGGDNIGLRLHTIDGGESWSGQEGIKM